MNNQIDLTATGNAADQTQVHNLTYASRLKGLAWFIEIVLVLVGLGIAFAQAYAMPEGSGVAQMFPVFGVFVVLAAVELAKIPAATVVFHAKRWGKLLPLVGLSVASLISFETIFNGFERYAHLTAHPVSEAKARLNVLQGDKERLLTTALKDETDGSRVADLDADRINTLREAVDVYERAAERARSNLDSEETKELRDQLANLIEQQDTAGEQADKAWIEEQQWINERLKNDAIDNKTRDQLNRRMRGMPPRQAVVAEARAKYDAQIKKLNQSIEASIIAPSPEALALLNDAENRLKDARKQLRLFEDEVADRVNTRIDNELAAEDAAKKRSGEIEAIEAKIVTQQLLIDEESQASQMHRWAAFVFGVEASEVSDEQVKRTSAIFGVILGVVGALTGASVAMYSEWFRTRGIQPRIVEKKVEVEVPTIVYKYVPVPIGDNLQEEVDGILQALPPDAAKELRSQLVEFTNTDLTEKEMPHAKAA